MLKREQKSATGKIELSQISYICGIDNWDKIQGPGDMGHITQMAIQCLSSLVHRGWSGQHQTDIQCQFSVQVLPQQQRLTLFFIPPFWSSFFQELRLSWFSSSMTGSFFVSFAETSTSLNWEFLSIQSLGFFSSLCRLILWVNSVSWI